MTPPVWSLLALTFIAYCQASSEYDRAVQLLEELDVRAEEQVNGVHRLIKDGQMKLAEEGELSLLRSRGNTQDILQEAERRKCPQDVRSLLSQMGSTDDDRWTDCMNLTQRIIDFEGLAYELYSDFVEFKPVICNTINNLTLCWHESLMEKGQCIYNGMTGYMNKFKSMKEELLVVVEKIHQLFIKTKSVFTRCIFGHENRMKANQLQVLNGMCLNKLDSFSAE